ncbi:MAG: DUF2804 domain-containing protein [Butyrivibrio sp.]|uniref:DUF2804 domain-containing protein n=1 Tax=Butyrivibrio sp. TaxID=28121 RepID=UPI0025E15E1C|nr:DUF2804 domain-containing protein [Butyrivibrio sp.]MCR5770649.1 DUF2804 domain-containing protein [Butyrivibrio sp.]
MRSIEITDSQLLLGNDGEIVNPGWARSQIWQYKRDMIKAPKFRIKEWDYYMIIHDADGPDDESFAAAFTLSDDGYIGLQSVSLLHFGPDTPHEHTQTVLNVFPMGKMHMPESSEKGNASFKNDTLHLLYKKDENSRHIKCAFKNFNNGKNLKADIILDEPHMDSMVIATPWDKKHAFYYNQKINCMKASGTITYDGKTYSFDKNKDYATLDWGRGVWTYDNTWYWGNGNAKIDGHDFGFNIGYGFGNTSAATENVIIYDGIVHKLDDITIEIPNDISLYDMDSPRYMEDWKISSSDKRFEMTFKPVLDRAAKLDYKLIISDQHQVFGRMNGKAVLDDDKVIEVKDMLCFIEKVHNKY